MIIDFHTHAYPDKIADKGVQYIGDFYALPMYGKGTIAHLKPVSYTHLDVYKRQPLS